ncbi:MAG: hypothetical protein JRH20_18300 [Deltaproteobacteria bacterium]|nr:hypothetical protein [Deltaproteobacteria bacterium]
MTDTTHPPAAPQARSFGVRLLRARDRLESAGAVARMITALVGVAIGVAVGFDMRALGEAAAYDRLFSLLLVFVAPLPIAALTALYHHPLHVWTLPWPLSARWHFSASLRIFFRDQLPWLGAAAGIVIGATSGRDPGATLRLGVFFASSVLGGLLASFGSVALCAWASDTEQRWIRDLRRGLGGAFGSERHAPFFYLPALGFALSAFAAPVAQAGALRWALKGISLPAALLLQAPLLMGFGVLFVAAMGYGRRALRVIPRVQEEARTVYGGRPAPADPPYGLWVARLLPRRAAASYRKVLREQARAHRGLWGGVALVALFSLAYGVNVGAPLGAAPLLGVVLVIWSATLPLRRTPRLHGVSFVLTLPRTRLAESAGRLLAGLFVVAHIIVFAGGAIGARHGWALTMALATLGLGFTLMVVVATRPRVGAQRRWSASARLLPALGLGIGVVTLAWWQVGLSALACGALAAVFLLVWPQRAWPQRRRSVSKEDAA